MITITLPYPISANRYWRPVPIGKHITIVPTSEAKAYKRDVRLIVRQSGVRDVMAGRLRVHVQLYPARPQDWERRARKDPMNWDDDVRCIDLDNARKVLYDAMKDVVFLDDKQVWQDSAERMEPDGEARVVVTVSRVVRHSPQPTLALMAESAAA